MVLIPIPDRRAHLIGQSSVGVTGRGVATGYQGGLHFDHVVGALDATGTIPAGSTRKPSATRAIRCISSSWWRK